MRLTCVTAVMLLALSHGATAQTQPVTRTAPGLTDILKSSPASDWEKLDPARTLTLSLGEGRQVVMYLADFAAPNTVKNILTFANAGYWDGLAIVRVQDNYVVQWGDPDGDSPRAKSTGTVPATLRAEFDQPIKKNSRFLPLASRDAYAETIGFWEGFAAARDIKSQRQWLTHCYGAVGVGRGGTADSGNGQELYVVNGHSPRHLDRNVTVVGRVISGMEHFSSLPRGTGPLGFYEKPEQRTTIVSVRTGTSPTDKSVTYERLRIPSRTFNAILKNRRERKDGWFLTSPGGVDLCNTPLPVRIAK
jgi:peptidylprolyl isomerase